MDDAQSMEMQSHDMSGGDTCMLTVMQLCMYYSQNWPPQPPDLGPEKRGLSGPVFPTVTLVHIYTCMYICPHDKITVVHL